MISWQSKTSRGEKRDADLFSLVTSDRTMEQSCIRGSLDQTLEKGFSQREVGHDWNRLLERAVMAPTPQEFKEHLKDALSHMVQL